MLVGYLNETQVKPFNFAKNVFDKGLGVYGSWPFNTAHAFELCGGKIRFAVGRLSSFVDLHKHLMNGIPVIISVRGSIDGAPKAYANGHLLVVVGWDAQHKKVICHDPALPTNNATLRRYSIYSFLKAWESSKRLAYLCGW
jgi:hypothetical protein